MRHLESVYDHIHRAVYACCRIEPDLSACSGADFDKLGFLDQYVCVGLSIPPELDSLATREYTTIHPDSPCRYIP